MLGFAIRLFDEHPAAAAEVRQRFHAFTVDEYQDVNPLQQALLERWLGEREELCVVGDDYQTIYTFTGATPEYLLSFPERYPDAHVVRLEQNYRSTPQILTVANALAANLGGFHKELHTTTDEGPNPTARPLPDADAEVAFVLGEVRRLLGEGVPLEEMAVLYRINARSEPFEEAFAAAGIPYQVRDGAFLRRPGPRAVLARLRRATATDPVAAVEHATDAVGFDPATEPDDAAEVTRQADLARLRALAAEFKAAHRDADVAGFTAELARRFSTVHSGRGVNLLTYHRAKGLWSSTRCSCRGCSTASCRSARDARRPIRTRSGDCSTSASRERGVTSSSAGPRSRSRNRARSSPRSACRPRRRHLGRPPRRECASRRQRGMARCSTG